MLYTNVPFLLLIVFLRKVISRSSLFQSSLLLLDTLVQRKATAGSMSGCARFVIYKHFATTEWKRAFLSAFSRGLLSSTHKRYLVAGVFTVPVSAFLNISTASSICSFMSTTECLPSSMLRVIPRNLWVFPLVMVRAPNFSLKISRSLLITFGSACNILLSFTYHPIVHCDPLITLLAVHLFYRLISRPMPCKVLAYRSYHNRANSMQP